MINTKPYLFALLCTIGFIAGCKKENATNTAPDLPVACMANIADTVNAYDTVYFDASCTTGSTTLFWQFGDGNTSIASDTQYVYTNGGTYTILLIVTNADGADTITKQLVVKACPIGYQGDNCDVEVRAKYCGRWYGTTNCCVTTSGDSITIIPSSTDITKVSIQNLAPSTYMDGNVQPDGTITFFGSYLARVDSWGTIRMENDKIKIDYTVVVEQGTPCQCTWFQN